MTKISAFVIMTGSLLLAACGNGGGGGGGAGAAETSKVYNVTISAIEVKKKGSEELLPVEGLPIEGASYTEQP